MRPSIVLVPRELEVIVGDLASSFEVIKAWEHPADADFGEARALICFGHQSPEPFLARMPRAELVACFTTGYDAIDVDGLAQRGIKTSYAAGAAAEPVAEFALALILASYRNIVAGAVRLRAGDWVAGGKPLIGKSLDGARIGIVGLGAIGQAFAKKCVAFSAKISWWGPRDKPGAPWSRASSLEALARDNDILVVCTSADSSNTKLISADVIDAVGPDGLLVNIARGQLVDEDALIDALKAGRLGAAAIDVYEQEPTPAQRWVDVPNIICTPHIAGASAVGLNRMVAVLRTNLDAFFLDHPLTNPIPTSGG